ncbi:MAG: RnfABCDGE type electron transport complex subunit G [Bacteroidales bacterium]|nr:RnfABCDGE type electron transport complex subunit G [Bacteroidales bacterium]
MAKIESSLKNMVISLLVITFVAGLSLALVQQVTQDPIAKAHEQKQVNAIANVVSEFDNNPLETKTRIAVDGDSLDVYTATKNKEIVGYAILSYTNSGFGGLVQVMIGFNPDGTIYNTVVVNHQETPGLGDQMTTEKFRSQFKGFDFQKQKATVKKDGGDVDAITAATISSRAFCNTIRKAYCAYNQLTNNTASTDAESGATK